MKIKISRSCPESHNDSSVVHLVAFHHIYCAVPGHVVCAMNNSCQNLPLPRVLRDLRDYETASRDTCSCELQASMFLSVSRTEHINWRYRGRVLSHASSLELSDRFR